MRGPFDFEPRDIEYGSATSALRQIVGEWQAIDWFEPPSGDAARAIRTFEEHNALCHAAMPDVFTARVTPRIVRGGWPELHAFRMRAQLSTNWDWKFSGLKVMTKEHSSACGWSLEKAARTTMAKGTLIVMIGSLPCWTNLGPALDVPAPLRDDLYWYLNHAVIDLCDALEWQLAEDHVSIHGNPMVPLLRCYAEGFYPICLSPTEIELFPFESAGASLGRVS